jgi:hypothetical protein
LPVASCLLPVASCLLPVASCLLHLACCIASRGQSEAEAHCTFAKDRLYGHRQWKPFPFHMGGVATRLNGLWRNMVALL